MPCNRAKPLLLFFCRMPRHGKVKQPLRFLPSHEQSLLLAYTPVVWPAYRSLSLANFDRNKTLTNLGISNRARTNQSQLQTKLQLQRCRVAVALATFTFHRCEAVHGSVARPDTVCQWVNMNRHAVPGWRQA